MNKDIVMIDWTDVASVDLGLFSDEDIEEGLQHPKVIIVGILVKEDNESYYVAKEMWDTFQYKYLHLIPKKYVDKITVLGRSNFPEKCSLQPNPEPDNSKSGFGRSYGYPVQPKEENDNIYPDGCGKTYVDDGAMKLIRVCGMNFGRSLCYECRLQPHCAKTNLDLQTDDFTQEKDSAKQDQEELRHSTGTVKGTGQNKEAPEYFCDVCKDECDCHMFVGGSGKACPDCREDNKNEDIVGNDNIRLYAKGFDTGYDKCQHDLKSKVKCKNCGREKGKHYGTLCFCYEGDKNGNQDKFQEQNKSEKQGCGKEYYESRICRDNICGGERGLFCSVCRNDSQDLKSELGGKE